MIYGQNYVKAIYDEEDFDNLRNERGLNLKKVKKIMRGNALFFYQKIQNWENRKIENFGYFWADGIDVIQKSAKSKVS